jgi:hypothetical protein
MIRLATKNLKKAWKNQKVQFLKKKTEANSRWMFQLRDCKIVLLRILAIKVSFRIMNKC